jgi:dUTP pyrophosphatase
LPNNNVRIGVLRLAEGSGLPLPAYVSADSAGADVVAALSEDLVLAPLARALVPTGFSLEIPAGYEVQLRPRSGLALNAGLTLLNAPGTIDADYRGPVGVIVANLGSEPYTIHRGDRIAQMVVAPVIQALFREVNELGTTDRGTGGFGSTGR